MSEETGWVIEHGESETSRPRYWAGMMCGAAPKGTTIKAIISLWSFDNLKAIRFARRADALAIRENIEWADPDGKTHRVCEHGWGP